MDWRGRGLSDRSNLLSRRKGEGAIDRDVMAEISGYVIAAWIDTTGKQR